MADKKIVVDQGQCLMDVAIQHCGDATALYELALLNGLGLTDDLKAGLPLIKPKPVNEGIVKYLHDSNRRPATGDPNPKVKEQEGLEFWAIEYDFVIS